MPKGLSTAAKKAKAYVLKHPGELNAEELAKKFGLHPSTVYRAEWWKGRDKSITNTEVPAQDILPSKRHVDAKVRRMNEVDSAITRHTLKD